MVVIGLVLLGICVFAYLMIEPFMNLRKQKIERREEAERARKRYIIEQQHLRDERQKAYRDKRKAILKAKREARDREILKQSLSKKDYQMYEQANNHVIMGGHGNSELLSWQYGRDENDKDSQGKLAKR